MIHSHFISHGDGGVTIEKLIKQFINDKFYYLIAILTQGKNNIKLCMYINIFVWFFLISFGEILLQDFEVETRFNFHFFN